MTTSPVPARAQPAQPARPRLVQWLVILLLLAAPVAALGGALLWARAGDTSAATTAAATMETANALYAAGQPTLAAQAYQQLRDQGYGGRALLYNLGIAQLESGDALAAVETLRTAQRVAPRDAQIRAALADAERLARTAGGAPGAPVLGAPDTGPLAQIRRQWLAGTEAALLALLGWVVCAALLLVGSSARPAGGRRRVAFMGALLAALLMLGALALLAA